MYVSFSNANQLSMLIDIIQHYERNKDFVTLKIRVVVSCVMMSICQLGRYHIWGKGDETFCFNVLT